MMTLRHITAAEERHQQRERERERERERDRVREIKTRKGNLTERETDRNIFHNWIRQCNF